MPMIKPLSEFNRSQNTVIDELKESKEPIYLTRNGSACVVVMDAEAFDHAMDFRNEICEQELQTYRGLMRGYQEILDGQLVSADQVDLDIRRARGWL